MSIYNKIKMTVVLWDDRRKGFKMAGTISSLGIGSSILTQDVLDQLRQVDESSFLSPLTNKISIASSQVSAMGQISTWMSDLATAAYDLKSFSLYSERTATVTGSGVSVTAAANTDLQSFSLEVVSLATKTVKESGQFASKTDPVVASGTGSLNLNVGGTDYTINYDATTTLESLKNTINTIAGEKAGASIVQLSDGNFRLFLSSKETGAAQNITITDTSGLLNGTQLTTGMTAIQSGTDATFKFNGVNVTRSSNVITDLVAGATITLEKAEESATVDITQNQDIILEKLKSFVEKYNAAAGGIAKMTHSSAEESQRGIFNADSTVKSMLRELQNMMIGTLGSSMANYGLELDKSGVLSLKEDVFKSQMSSNASNVQAFFAGGTYLNTDGSTTTLTGFFTTFQSGVENYSEYNGLIDSYETALQQKKTRLETDKENAIERLDKKYETMAKQFAAYDAMIARMTQQGSFLTQMITSANAAQSS